MKLNKLVLLVLAPIALSACAQVNSIISMDASGAIAKAQAAGTTDALARIPCYQGIGGLTAVPVNGILSLYETTQEAEDLAKGACGPVIAGVAIQILQHIPIAVPIP